MILAALMVSLVAVAVLIAIVSRFARTECEEALAFTIKRGRPAIELNAVEVEMSSAERVEAPKATDLKPMLTSTLKRDKDLVGTWKVITAIGRRSLALLY